MNIIEKIETWIVASFWNRPAFFSKNKSLTIKTPSSKTETKQRGRETHENTLDYYGKVSRKKQTHVLI